MLNWMGVTLLVKLLKACFPFCERAKLNSLGITLIETIVALSIFASAGTAVLLGLSTAHRSSAVVNASSVAENLARNQMEYVWTLPYILPDTGEGNPYESIDVNSGLPIPSGFGVRATAVVFNLNSDPVEDDFVGCIQKVVVTVTRDGADYHVLETLRASDSATCPK